MVSFYYALHFNYINRSSKVIVFQKRKVRIIYSPQIFRFQWVPA